MSEKSVDLATVKFPLDSFKDAAIHLRRPFTAEAVKFRILQGSKVAAYIDAALAIERLNLVIPHLWTDEYEPVAGTKGLLCRLTVDGITRLDVGSDYQGKGLYSDAFKRGAVKFGVGVSLRAIPRINLSGNHLDSKGISSSGEVRCRELYATWLKGPGETNFGPVLDHGDVEGAIGDLEADQPAPDTSQPELPAEPEALTDAKAVALKEAAATLYAGLTKEQAKGLPPAAFKRAAAGAAHSHEKLEELVADLQRRADA